MYYYTDYTSCNMICEWGSVWSMTGFSPPGHSLLGLLKDGPVLHPETIPHSNWWERRGSRQHCKEKGSTQEVWATEVRGTWTGGGHLLKPIPFLFPPFRGELQRVSSSKYRPCYCPGSGVLTRKWHNLSLAYGFLHCMVCYWCYNQQGKDAFSLVVQAAEIR